MLVWRGRWLWSAAGAALAVVVGLGAAAGPAVAARAAGSGPNDPPVIEIVGGSTVSPGRFPWVVRLSVGCAGALTAPNVVLTAGHCIDQTGRNTGIVVTASAADLRSPDAVMVRSAYVTRAPRFRDATLGDDWAVIELERALDLPTLPLTPSRQYDRGRFTVMGWGVTREGSTTQQRHLRAAPVPYVSDGACRAAYRDIGYDIVPNEMICAGDMRRGGVDACQGDSGGPMVRRDGSGRWVQVGIVSWGYGCARRQYPGVYTQVSTFADDITSAVRALT
jgi:secreted trypsin-like serine protease